MWFQMIISWDFEKQLRLWETTTEVLISIKGCVCVKKYILEAGQIINLWNLHEILEFDLAFVMEEVRCVGV
jgi:hypothetical protein